ncbi:MAG: hypothetical protein A2504_06000 [Bdellovibrionales bacterium RIFOXYD12_FULL_39_22]|nr:MAG: hypothetical protein A2385_08320 [Bdellovibrionales bacterium RIFOXYB1_FULL_39_21]OFZ45291.1 MAG: hypothetical protein A2485_06215 [Bdellovibrionales bacterium RIFOXYC12_FULL_39_17]OFZ45519.1 MAG: hypothetical protein A2404_02900 [Bdellovibrionales bacterium RIFOXYC1_FULL_39_130]OFZ75002.1 MAG: hypothetical protein A2451_13480 [Bdellovibrionales bacterium RIFOXYC2_FULL_39_8]OFZ77380.1 MAG: hypothetical protein A2560_08490 [Bdellovibrionales bacterium RIFOXYD1_FULL_39_84]OFZ91509.1 MAG:
MKKVLLSALMVTSLSSFANLNILTEGDIASSIYDVLKAAGVSEDCAGGTCALTAQSILCSSTENGQNFACSLQVQDYELGTNSELSVSKELASSLYKSLENAGLESDGACGTSPISAQKIDCSSSRNDIFDKVIKCTITP